MCRHLVGHGLKSPSKPANCYHAPIIYILTIWMVTLSHIQPMLVLDPRYTTVLWPNQLYFSLSWSRSDYYFGRNELEFWPRKIIFLQARIFVDKDVLALVDPFWPRGMKNLTSSIISDVYQQINMNVRLIRMNSKLLSTSEDQQNINNITTVHLQVNKVCIAKKETDITNLYINEVSLCWLPPNETETSSNPILQGWNFWKLTF